MYKIINYYYYYGKVSNFYFVMNNLLQIRK